MGYDTEIPAHQIGGHMVLWAIRGYGLSEVWVKTSSTVAKWLLNPRLVIQGSNRRLKSMSH